MSTTLEQCAMRRGCSQWVVLTAHERGRELRSRRDIYGERVYTTMAEEADRLFASMCESKVETCK